MDSFRKMLSDRSLWKNYRIILAKKYEAKINAGNKNVNNLPKPLLIRKKTQFFNIQKSMSQTKIDMNAFSPKSIMNFMTQKEEPNVIDLGIENDEEDIDLEFVTNFK